MMASFVPTPTIFSSRYRNRNPSFLSPRRRQLPRLTYATDLQTLTKTIDPESTDKLLQSIQPTVQSSQSISSKTLEQMVLHLADSRGLARLSLVEAFGRIGSRAVPLLLQAISECPNPVVRRSCGKALAKIGDDSATNILIKTLTDDPDTVTRSSAAGALAKMGAKAVPNLIGLLSDPHVSMTAKGHAAWAMAFMQGDALHILMQSVQHPNVDVRVAVVGALGAVALGDALPVMDSAAEDDDWGEDQKVKKIAIDALIVALDDENAEVKAEVATALANSNCTEYADKIAQFLNDEDMELRRAAALALLKLRDGRFIEVLQQRVDDENENDSVRNVARLAVAGLERAMEEDEDWD